jgi:ankyrin repeat protein
LKDANGDTALDHAGRRDDEHAAAVLALLRNKRNNVVILKAVAGRTRAVTQELGDI